MSASPSVPQGVRPAPRLLPLRRTLIEGYRPPQPWSPVPPPLTPSVTTRMLQVRRFDQQAPRGLDQLVLKVFVELELLRQRCGVMHTAAAQVSTLTPQCSSTRAIYVPCVYRPRAHSLTPSCLARRWLSRQHHTRAASGPKRDLVGDLTKSVRAAGLHMGLYHSIFEWYNSLYLQDKANNYTTSRYVDEVYLPEAKEINNLYAGQAGLGRSPSGLGCVGCLVTPGNRAGAHLASAPVRYQPDLIWSDGDWEANSSYWKSQEFLAWLYNDSPNKDNVIVNDRWGMRGRTFLRLVGADCRQAPHPCCWQATTTRPLAAGSTTAVTFPAVTGSRCEAEER